MLTGRNCAPFFLSVTLLVEGSDMCMNQFKSLTPLFLITLLSVTHVQSALGSESGDCLPQKVSQSVSQEPEVTVCTDPRPQMCTMDYRPVCGTKSDGSQATYSNGCGACSDPEVVEYRDGECETHNQSMWLVRLRILIWNDNRGYGTIVYPTKRIQW